MKKEKSIYRFLIPLLALFCAIGVVKALTIEGTPQEIKELFGQEQEQEATLGATWSGEAVNSATTTTSALPVMVLDSNTAREGAIIINDSDTIVYLHLGYFADASAASATVDINQGIRLNASGGSYEIDNTNMYKNQVWATSTVASKVIIWTEF